ncbi:MAG: HEAT repeat domain-containing protein [Nitrospira sp.]|nr:HEAT repeat domain-containing protein [Nitrospira sp.]
MTRRQIWFNLAGLGLVIALMGLVYWLNTGARAVPGLIEDLRSDDAQAQALAALHLGHIGEDAKPAVPVLVAMATASPTSYAATTAAGALPTIDLSAARQVMAAWLPKLHDANPQTRRDAISMLGTLGPAAKPAASALVLLLSDEDTVVRERAARALGAIGLPIDVVMRGLIQALRDPEWTVRQAAVTQFSFSGFSSHESLAVLRELTKDSNRTVAQLARSSVASAEHPIQASVYSMMLKQGTNRTYTLHQLAKLGPRAAETVSGIAAILTAEQPLERYLAACALEEIGQAAAAATPALQRNLNDPDPIVREAAADALQSIRGKGSDS